jgi:hypothetical protein
MAPAVDDRAAVGADQPRPTSRVAALVPHRAHQRRAIGRFRPVAPRAGEGPAEPAGQVVSLGTVTVALSAATAATAAERLTRRTGRRII